MDEPHERTWELIDPWMPRSTFAILPIPTPTMSAALASSASLINDRLQLTILSTQQIDTTHLPIESGGVVSYLRDRGVIEAGPAHVVELGGGVSNLVLAITTRERRVVFKQALPRLRVADEWLAKRERALAEARALTIARGLAPGSVPRVIDVDPERCAITIEAAPPDWRAWKDDLLRGEADLAVADRLGRLLATWHRGTWGAVRELDEWESFEQLRIDPYYREVARRHPAHAGAIVGYADAMARRRTCLVHGDFSPKNVLVGGKDLWVIDFEVAHYGDPAFDLAFLISHLLLKAVALPSSQAGLLACVERFDGAYRSAAAPLALARPEYILGQVGCLVLARVDGKSPVEYLDDAQRRRARMLAFSLITSPPGSLAGLAGALADAD
jgi:aminoglycoside phosphotransferase (APT) family kinase protein